MNNRETRAALDDNTENGKYSHTSAYRFKGGKTHVFGLVDGIQNVVFAQVLTTIHQRHAVFQLQQNGLNKHQ